MKYLVIALSGASDEANEEMSGRTPLELAKIPNLNHFTKIGKLGQVKLLNDKLPASSDVSLLNLLGYDAAKTYTGQGPLEAANLDLKLEDNEIAFRMNFITESDGILADATGGGISTKEARALINFLNKKIASDFVRFFPGAGYRHVAVIKDSHGYEALSARTYSPENIIGENIESYFPKGPGEELLKKLMFNAKLLLQDHEINQVRLDLQENPANMIWLWGQGKPVRLEKFQDIFGKTGAMISAMEFAKGIARCAGLTVLEATGLTGDSETDYEKKARLMIEALQEKNVVCLHLNACDEASRRGNAKAKISALEAIDFFVLSKAKKYLDSHKDCRILITSCHNAPWKKRARNKDWAPFVMAGKNVTTDDIEQFSETAAKTSEIKVGRGNELIQSFLN